MPRPWENSLESRQALDAGRLLNDPWAMPSIMVDHRWIGDHGIGRFARETIARLNGAQRVLLDGSPLHPMDPWRLAKAIKRQQPDVFFTPGFNAPRKQHAPLVITLHDLIHLDVPEENSRAKAMYYKHIVTPAARSAAGILTVSAYSRTRIAEHLGIDEQKITVVGNGVSACFKPDGETGHHLNRHHQHHSGYVLYVGNHKPHKNVPRLIDAFARAKIDSTIGMVMTGKPDEAMFAQIAQAGLTERVRFIEGLSDEQLAATYRGAVALVCPSLYEGFGLPVLEAMACGTPVVCANTTSLPEVVGDAAQLVDPMDTDAIAQAIEYVVNDPVIHADLRARGLKRADQFSWDKTADRVKHVLDTIMQ